MDWQRIDFELKLDALWLSEDPEFEIHLLDSSLIRQGLQSTVYNTGREIIEFRFQTDRDNEPGPVHRCSPGDTLRVDLEPDLFLTCFWRPVGN